MTDYDDLVGVVDAAELLGRVDVVVNNAGSLHLVEFFDTTDEDFETRIEVDLKGAYYGFQAAGEQMLEDGGSIVNVLSSAADQGFVEPGSVFYAAAKEA